MSNADKRKLYDKYGKEGLQPGAGGGTGGFDGFGFSGGDHFSFERAEDLFKNFFGGKDPFKGFMDDDDDFFNMGSMGFTKLKRNKTT